MDAWYGVYDVGDIGLRHRSNQELGIDVSLTSKRRRSAKDSGHISSNPMVAVVTKLWCHGTCVPSSSRILMNHILGNAGWWFEKMQCGDSLEHKDHSPVI